MPSLWLWLFGRRVKWTLERESEDGEKSKVRCWLWNPTPENIEDLERDYIRPLEESGWRVLIRPRQRR